DAFIVEFFLRHAIGAGIGEHEVEAPHIGVSFGNVPGSIEEEGEAFAREDRTWFRFHVRDGLDSAVDAHILDGWGLRSISLRRTWSLIGQQGPTSGPRTCRSWFTAFEWCRRGRGGGPNGDRRVDRRGWDIWRQAFRR